MEERCEELSHPDPFLTSLSLFIVAGILVSYLPQHYKIIARRTSQGLSPLFVLLGCISATASLTNILTLPESVDDISCCHDISGPACMAALLGITQIGVQWICFSFIMLLFLIFFPRSDNIDDMASSTPSLPSDAAIEDPKLPTWKEALIVLYISLIFFLACFIGSLIIGFGYPSHMLAWSNTLGVIAAVLAGIQYVPQIYTTWRLQAVGSLSVPMMCIQTPGSFVFAASLAARLGANGWSVWGLFIWTGCLQGCLLIMSIWFLWRDRRNSLPASGGGNRLLSDENTPLLITEDGRRVRE